MLIKCPECDLQVSDRARTCPHCGYPMTPNVKSRPNRPTARRMRLPNGFGQISFIRGKALRNPYRAMVTVGKSETTGRPITKPLKPQAYFKTYNDAYQALMEYHLHGEQPVEDITVSQLYKKFLESKQSSLSPATLRTYAYTSTFLANINDVKVKDIRAAHIHDCVEAPGIPDSSRRRIKQLLNMMLDYAVEYDYAEKNYARASSVQASYKASEDAHSIYTDEELEILWKHSDNYMVKVILIQCYSGWRPIELCQLKLENINLTDWSFSGGVKTAAGKNRTVPIHSKIKPLVADLYKISSDLGASTLVQTRAKQMAYQIFFYHYNAAIKGLGLSDGHKPHDGRKTFITMAKKRGVDEYALKRIVGHKISDITEGVYTDRDLEWLRSEIEKV